MMMKCKISFLLIICIINTCLQTSLCSYLGYPRIQFNGRFRADVNYENNDRCLFCSPRIYKGVDNPLHGTNEFEFLDTVVTSVIYEDGTRSTVDPIVGKRVVTNLDRPFAKLVDLDVSCQLHSTVYGMKFGIQWYENDSSITHNIALYGDWTPSVIVQYMWGGACTGGSNGFSSQTMTTVTGIEWSDIGDSQILRELQEAVGVGNLAVKFTINFFTQDGAADTIGTVVGFIGVPSASDTLNIPGSREMLATDSSPVGISGECIRKIGNPVVNTAPFEVDTTMREVRIDLSNSLPRDEKKKILNIGSLQLGLFKQSDSCVQLLGQSTIPYAKPINGGIHAIAVDSAISELESAPLVLVQVVNGTDGDTNICLETMFGGMHTAVILLEEINPFVRPQGYYVARLDSTEHTSINMTFYVTQYGVPVGNTVVHLSEQNYFGVIDAGPSQPVLPEGGIVPTDWNGVTDNNGTVTFEFIKNSTIPLAREYEKPDCNETDCPNVPCPTPVCTLPIDGQVYYFNFCAKRLSDDTCQNPLLRLAMFAFSDYTYTSPPTWVDHVEPIFSVYAKIAPIMYTIMDMSSYEDVSKPHNIELLKKTFDLDFNDPSYMPTMRDLSPIKRTMICEWLDNPCYDSKCSIPTPPGDPVFNPSTTASITPPDMFTNPRCANTNLYLKKHPSEMLPYFKDIVKYDFKMKGNNKCLLENYESFSGIAKIKGRPLLGNAQPTDGKAIRPEGTTCSKETLKDQLQTAMQLEWATIPPYLTSLYSIAPGCNIEIYQTIRHIVMQEMYHFTLAANMIIALGGSPKIDTPIFTPSYPGYLPGCVLPRLKVSLEKLSLSHVFSKFMAIEVPQETEVAGDFKTDWFTIGAFYDEIKDCIEQLDSQTGEDIFDASTESQQVLWSGWDSTSNVGELQPILNTSSALDAIKVITSQGEGSTPMDPHNVNLNQLAHFYKFEEIVCKRHLVMLSLPDEKYAYLGTEIKFNPLGVYPMRNDPRARTLIPNTRCYTEAKIFHSIYRRFLRKLQETFNGNPENIFTAVQLMESLQVHAKRLMLIDYDPDDADDTTCGPVWDHHWPLVHINPDA